MILSALSHLYLLAAILSMRVFSAQNSLYLAGFESRMVSTLADAHEAKRIRRLQY